MTGEAKAQEIRDHYGISFEMKDPKGGDEYEAPYVEIEVLFIPKEKRGQGIATDVMFDLIRWADSNGYILALDPSSDFGSSVARLRKFYGQFGFVGNKGRNKDFRTRYAMIRQPKKKADKQMKELNQLVENFFQPKRDTLGLDQLVEMVEDLINEQVYDANDEQAILSTLQSDQRYKDAAKHNSSTGKTLVITNMGAAPNRDAALDLIGAEKTKPYKRGSKYFIGGTMPKGFKVEFKAGRNPFAKENIAYSDLKKSIIETAKELDEVDIANSVTLVFSNPNTGHTEMIEDIDLTQEPKDTGKGGKADFSIDNKVFISHKDGADAKDFGQYGGITNLGQYDDVKKFKTEVNKILDDLGLKVYPSGIDFQKPITEDDVLLAGVFGKDFASESSGKNAVDFLIQGDIDFETFIDESDEGNPQAFIKIGGKKIYSRKEALDFSAASKNTGRVKEIFVNDISYVPMLSVRRGEASRKNLGPDVSGARAAVQAAGGRYANFILKPTKKGIVFFSHEMDDTQIKNVQKLEKQLSEKGITRKTNPMLDKMLSSISNYP